MPSQILDPLFGILKLDKLINFSISKINIDLNDVKILFNIISDLLKMKFLIINIHMDNFDEFIACVDRNRKLLGVVYGNMTISEAGIEERLKPNSNLKLFHYEPNLDIFI
jgi:hypothetical protein